MGSGASLVFRNTVHYRIGYLLFRSGTDLMSLLILFLPESDWACFRGCDISSSLGVPFQMYRILLQRCSKHQKCTANAYRPGLHCIFSQINESNEKMIYFFKGGACIRGRGHLCHGTMASPSLSVAQPNQHGILGTSNVDSINGVRQKYFSVTSLFNE